MSHLLTPAEVAARLRLKKTSHVYAMINTGSIKASNAGTGSRPRWLIRESEIEAFIQRREKKLAAPRKRANASVYREVPEYV